MDGVNGKKQTFMEDKTVSPKAISDDFQKNKLILKNLLSSYWKI